MSDESTLIEQSEKKNKPDKYIIGIYITLLIIGIIEAFSSSAREIAEAGNFYMPIAKHAFFLGAGTLLMIIVSKMDYTRFIKPSLIFVAFTLVALVATMLFGDNINGAQRGFSLGFMTLQPAELSKIAVVFILAFILARNMGRKEVDKIGIVTCIIIVSVFGFLLLMQGMTNTLLFMAISVAMLLIGGTSPKRLGKVVLIYAVIGGVFFIGKSVFEKSRLDDLDAVEQAEVKGSSPFRTSTWDSRLSDYFSELFDSKPYENPNILDNDQKLYSYLAQANGGVIGQGPGNSRETSRLPLAFSDYVFSIVTEDLGFVGAVFLLALYFCLLFRAGRIALKCKRAYPAMLIIGMAMVIVMQAFFHMAINTGVFPVSGQNLPLISKGGTSVLMICIAFGVMLSVSRTVANEQEEKESAKNLPENMRAINPTNEK